MAGRNINVRLSLVDRFTRPLRDCNQEVRDLARRARLAENQIRSMGRKANEQFKKMVKGAATVGAAFGGLAVGTGFKEAFNLEGYRLQLETATKDTQKAARIMKYSIDLANKTPFEGGQLVEAAASLESMGMSAEYWLPLVGDMAAATNKDFMQATEALIDAQTGELERLKEFGIKKDQIAKKAYEMFGDGVVNKSGQIQDFEKFNRALVVIMQDRFAGGMEKQATTIKGLWSTITGVAKSGLAELVGMTSDGAIRRGSALEVLKGQVEKVADAFTKWQQDGTLTQIGYALDNFVNRACVAAGEAVDFLRENFSTIKNTAIALFFAFAGYNIINTMATAVRNVKTIATGLSAAFKLLTGATDAETRAARRNRIESMRQKAATIAQKVAQTALTVATKAGVAVQKVFNLVLRANPLGIILTAITAVVAAGVALYKNWDKVKQKAAELWQKIKESPIGPLAEAIENAVKKTAELWEKFRENPLGFVKDAFDSLKNAVGNLIGKLKNLIAKIFGAKEAAEGIQPKTALDKQNQKFIEDHPEFKKYMPAALTVQEERELLKVNVPGLGNATGTSYFAGGITRINEGGRGEIVNLPNGTQIIPHDVSKKAVGKGNVTVNVTVQGNMIGNKEFVDSIGNLIAQRVMLAYGNI